MTPDEVKALGFGSRRLAKVLGLPFATVQRWAAGTHPPARRHRARLQFLAVEMELGTATGRHLRRLRRKPVARGRRRAPGFPPARVRRLLERLGWSGVELGRHLGVGGGEGHHWASGGKRPDGPAVVLMMGLERAVARGRPSPPALVRTPGEFAPERVAAILGRSGWSVGELGRRCRVCASAVRKWRDGKRKPRGSTRVLLEQIEAEVMGRREGPRA